MMIKLLVLVACMGLAVDLRCPEDGSSATYTGRSIGGPGGPTRYEYRCDLTGRLWWDSRQPW